MKLCFVPLDSRPCTRIFPEQLAQIRGAIVCTPPVGLLDFFRKPSYEEPLKEWILNETRDAEILVLAIDQLLYGGLLASRTGERSLQRVSGTLAWLEELKAQRPKLKIFATNILMRTSISALNQESKVWWEKIAIYSHMKYKALEGTAEEKERAQTDVYRLEQEIPQRVLADFLNARERNHLVNIGCIKLVHQGVFERLFILQEDCTAAGLQLIEQKTLTDLIESLHLEDRVYMHNGTDEAGMEMLMYSLTTGQTVDVQVIWLHDNQHFTALYEDRPFSENLFSHMRSVGLVPCQQSSKCLFVLPPKHHQYDVNTRLNDEAYTAEECENMCRQIEHAVSQGKQCFLLDVCYANGGNYAFMKCLARFIPVTSLCGYASWNTACNSLGTILSQILACDGQNTEMNWLFTSERLADDLIYQARIRSTLSEALEAVNEDVLCIHDIQAARLLLEKAVLLHQEEMKEIFSVALPEFSFQYHWPRVFEVHVKNKGRI